MTDPLTRLRRQPMLIPLLLPLLAVIAAGAGVFWLGTWARTTVVILVRHGEAGTTTAGDPELSLAGERRAARLGEFIADTLPGNPVDHLYAADTRRAQQTAASVANQFKLPINLLASSDWARLPSRIKREHRGQTVVRLRRGDAESRSEPDVQVALQVRDAAAGCAARQLNLSRDTDHMYLINNHLEAPDLIAFRTNASCAPILRSASTESWILPSRPIR